MLTPQMNCSPYFHQKYSFYVVGSTSTVRHALQCEGCSNWPDTAWAPVSPFWPCNFGQLISVSHFPYLVDGGTNTI